MSAANHVVHAAQKLVAPVVLRAALSFAGAGLVVAVWNTAAPFAHGWWLVSFLLLVGALAQSLLGAGRTAIVLTAPRVPVPRWGTRGQAVLWNAGTLLVAVGVLASTRLGVVIGSVLLLCALAALASELRAGAASAARTQVERGYVALLAFLAASVVVGTALAWDLPWA
jgi:hypothetical protein